MIQIDDTLGFDGRSFSVGGKDGGVVITIPFKDAMTLWRSVRAHVSLSGEGEEDFDQLGGFFDFIKKAGKAIGNVVKTVVRSPIVKAAVGIIPGGATVLTAVDVGVSAVEAADKALRRNPKAQKLLEAVERKDPKAAKAVQRLPKPLRAKLNAQLVLRRETRTLAKSVASLRTVMKRAGYTPQLQQAFRMPPAPWRKRR